MSVRLQFVRAPDPISSLIAWFGKSTFSHVDAILPSGLSWGQEGWLLGARSDDVGGKPPGVQIRPPDYEKVSLKVVFTVPATEAQEGAFYDFLHKQVGKPYDKKAILGFVTGRNWRDDDAWFCDELQARAGEISTLFPFLYLDASGLTPGASSLPFSAIGATWDTL